MIPVMIRLAINELPPLEMNGSGIPLVGNMPMVTEMLIMAWITIKNVRPMTSK